MNREISPEQLDHEIQQMFAGGDPPSRDGSPLLTIAAELRSLSEPSFREQLKHELLSRAEELQEVAETTPFAFWNQDPLPTLSRRQFALLPADPRSLLVSFLSHAAAIVLIASGIWAGQHTIGKRTIAARDLTYISIPLGQDSPHGGGGGGDHSTVQVSRGTPPKFGNTQLAPPAIVVRNDNSKLQVQPTVLGPPQIKLPESNHIGDLLSTNVTIPSNGTGSRGGMGSGSETGLGSGDGAGIGPGREAGIGGEAFGPGNGVSAPRAIYDPDPEYSDEARRAKYQGTVVLSLIVDPSGRARNIHVARSLGMGLDEKAIDAVRNWRFAPGMKDGRPVAVQVNIEVNFRLY